MDTEIRKIESTEWKLWKEFRLAALQESPLSFGNSYEIEKDFTETQWRQGLEKSEMLGVFSGETLIGCAGLAGYDFAQMQHKKRLFGVYVVPAHRGTGMADRLLKALIEHVGKNTLQITLGVKSINEQAIGFYKKHGFEVYGVEPRACKIGDAFYDDTLMVKFLG